MYKVRLFEGPVPTDGTATPIFDGFIEADGADKSLRSLLKEIVRFYCSDQSKRYYVQIWDDARQAWYIPSSQTHRDVPWDGLIPAENVSMVGSLRL